MKFYKPISIDVTKCSAFAERASRCSELAVHIKGTCIPAAYFSCSLSIYLRLFLPLVDYTVIHTSPDLEIQFDSAWNEKLHPRCSGVEHGSARFINPVSAKRDWKICETRVAGLKEVCLENFQSATSLAKCVFYVYNLSIYIKRCGWARRRWTFRANLPRY